MMWRARACLTLMLCLAVGACADTPAGIDSGLGATRFAALDSVFAAAVTLDRYRDQRDVSFERFREDARPVLKACRALSKDDALLRAVRAGCPQVTEYAAQGAAIETCDSSAACLRATVAMRGFVKRLRGVSRRTDRAVAAEHKLADECKQALTTPSPAYAVFETYDAAIVQMQRALRSRSAAAVVGAHERLAAADTRSQALPSNAALLERFRSDCA